jgi:hypothetical protein
MVETIVVIPVFILFFVGLMYFRQLYKHQLVVMRLARVAAVAYGMSGCNGSPTDNIAEDLVARGVSVGGTELGSGSTHIGSSSATNPNVGQISGSPVASALEDKGMDKDGIASVALTSKASAGSPLYSTVFQSSVTSTAYMSCGEAHAPGDPLDAFKYVKDLFKL